MERPRVLSSTPLLVVSDLQRALDFYAKLGVGSPDVWGEPPGFAMIHRDGFELMLSLAEGPGQVRPNGPHGAWDVYLRVTDVALEVLALAAAGVPIDKGPTDRFYEMREIEVVDPDGHRICFAQDTSYLAPPDAERWEGALDINGKVLRLVLKVWRTPRGDTRASLDSLDQGATNLPVDTLARDGAGLRFEMRQIKAVYEGTLGADGAAYVGTWTQGRALPLTFKKA
jgi:catechol 2,3-dioxygenase-like lactoylglutathione lyase family enzyme